jgi:hypothetical protein
MPATAIFDSGSDINLVSRRLVGDTPLLPLGDLTSKSAYGDYSHLYGHTVRVLEMIDDWGIAKKMYLSFVVAEIPEDILLGRPWEDDIDPVINNFPLSNYTWKTANSGFHAASTQMVKGSKDTNDPHYKRRRMCFT